MQVRSDQEPDDADSDAKKRAARTSAVKARTPLRYLGRNATSKTTRLFASSKVWGHAIPTRNCDIIMTLPAATDDETLMWLLARLRTRTPQIHVFVRHWKNTNVYAFYMTSGYQHLLKGAEELGLMKPLKDEYGGGMREFTMDEQDCYLNVDDEGHFLSSRERQSIVYQMLLNMRALKEETLGKIKFLEGQSIVPLLESKKIVSQVFPLHETETLLDLRKNWVQTFIKKQPLDRVSEYFGVKIAMYFAYLGHYTQALVFPTILGCLFWFFQSESQLIEDVCFMTFALFNVFWGTMYIEDWRRRCSELAYKWGTLDKKDVLLQDPRPLYTGYLVTSPVTGRLEMCYPTWKRQLFRYCITVPVIGICLTIVFFIMLVIFELQEWTNGLVSSEDIPAFCSYLPKILLAVSIGILDEVYKKIAFWLNDKENYRLDEMYETHLAIKLILFQFVNSFLSLFYIAFYLQDMNRLREQLATLLITRQVIGNIREAIVPYILWKMKLIKVGYDITGHMSPHTLEKELKGIRPGGSTEGGGDGDKEMEKGEGEEKEDNQTDSELILTQAEVESTMKKYEDTFEDYLEMFIQYGYVVLFSSAFPLAALCAFLNNVIEIRSDAFKLCVHLQRPFGKQVRSIGIWLGALRVMGIIAVVVNSALIGVSGQLKRMKPDLDTMTTIIVIVALEHGILVLKELITHSIPSKPRWIANEMARWEFQRREALKSHDSPNLRTQPIYYSPHTSPKMAHDNPWAHGPGGSPRHEASTNQKPANDTKSTNQKASYTEQPVFLSDNQASESSSDMCSQENSLSLSSDISSLSSSSAATLVSSAAADSASASSTHLSSQSSSSTSYTPNTSDYANPTIVSKSCSKTLSSRSQTFLERSSFKSSSRIIEGYNSPSSCPSTYKESRNQSTENTSSDDNLSHTSDLSRPTGAQKRPFRSTSLNISDLTLSQTKPFPIPRSNESSPSEVYSWPGPSFGLADSRQETRNRILQSVRNRQQDSVQSRARHTDIQ